MDSSSRPNSVFITVEGDRIRVIEVFRNAIASSSPIFEAAPKALGEAIFSQKPLSLNTEENNLLENGLRTLLMNIIEEAVDCKNGIMQFGVQNHLSDDTKQSVEIIENNDQKNKGTITKLLDLTLYLCENGYTEPGIIFVLLEDLTECSTISDCEQIFSYIESKQEVLGKAELLGRGKLVLLRACNQLLRRLSKANHVILCGRILMFLAHFFPISERSAANIKGAYNLSNKTHFFKSPPEEDTFIDFGFYRTFWSLQEFFNYPPSVVAPQKWKQFSEDLEVVLRVFENQSAEAAAAAPASSLPLLSLPSNLISHHNNHSSTNHNNYIGNDHTGDHHYLPSNSIHQPELPRLSTFHTSTFNTKFLTNPSLLALQLKDKNFRMHILLQCLILFDFLKSPGKGEKDDRKEAMLEEIKVLESHVKILLINMSPQGKQFLKRVEHIFEREKNWILWKQKGCVPFEKPAVTFDFSKDNLPKRRKFYMGNEHLDRLSKIASSHPKINDSKRIKVVPFREYFQPLAEDMDPESGIEEVYSHKHDKLYCWRGLRLAARNDFDAFTRFNEMSMEGVVPPDMLPKSVREQLHGKPTLHHSSSNAATNSSSMNNNNNNNNNSSNNVGLKSTSKPPPQPMLNNSKRNLEDDPSSNGKKDVTPSVTMDVDQEGLGDSKTNEPSQSEGKGNPISENYQTETLPKESVVVTEGLGSSISGDSERLPEAESLREGLERDTENPRPVQNMPPDLEKLIPDSGEIDSGSESHKSELDRLLVSQSEQVSGSRGLVICSDEVDSDKAAALVSELNLPHNQTSVEVLKVPTFGAEESKPQAGEENVREESASDSALLSDGKPPLTSLSSDNNSSKSSRDSEDPEKPSKAFDLNSDPCAK